MRFSTPLLVPSFSSKGFATIGTRRKKCSAVSEVLTFVAGELTDCTLFSAYDLYYGLIPNAWRFLDKPQVVFLDSGGYEAASDYDDGQITRPAYVHRQWSESRLNSVLVDVPKRLRLVVVNHDSRGSIEHQAEHAQRFFSRHPRHVHDFLVKPERAQWATVNIAQIVSAASSLRQFDVIGVTEKELGVSLLDRLVNVHRIRAGLDCAEMSAPIHVFGSLDPLTVPLFAAAGAEIFDGLSWLRYYFHNGLTVYRDHAGVLTENRGVQTRWDHVRAFAVSENVACLRKLALDLRTFAKSGSCDVLGTTGPSIERGLQALASRLHGE